MQTRRVVIVEDNPHDYEAVCRSLRQDTRFRYRFEHFDQGQPALERLAAADGDVDLVVLDWRLPDMTAAELVPRLVDGKTIPRFPVVVLTGSSPPSGQTFMNQGIQDYFEKTLLATALLPHIASNAIERHKLMQQLVQSEQTALEAERLAEIANRAKSTFLANMSHELRTPLTAVLGIAELLMEKVTPYDQREMLALIRSSGQHLADLLSDILDLAKIEAATLTIAPVDFHPFALVRDLCKVMQYPAADKGLTLTVIGGPAAPLIRADATRLRQILLNLIGNAIKFTESGGITVEMSYLDETTAADGVSQLKVSITDTGPGIPAGTEDSIFDRFYQAETSGKARRDGVGLGLPISRSLARLMGGDLQLNSSVNSGCRFDLVIAAPMVTSAPSPVNPSDAKASRQPTTSNRDWRERKILIAEDTHANQFLLRSLLKPTGADVECVDNGRLAVDHVLTQVRRGDPVDVILMDMQMPVMDGFEAVRRLREARCQTPIIAITAGAATSDRERCLLAGCQDYLSKPFSRNDLMQVIEKALLRGEP